MTLRSNSRETRRRGALEIVRLVNGQQNSSSSSGLVQGVGFQGHFTVGGTPLPGAARRRLQPLPEPSRACEKEIAITELDIRECRPAGDRVSPPNASARDYAAVVGACGAWASWCGSSRTGTASWVPGTVRGRGRGVLVRRGPGAEARVDERVGAACGGGGGCDGWGWVFCCCSSHGGRDRQRGTEPDFSGGLTCDDEFGFLRAAARCREQWHVRTVALVTTNVACAGGTRQQQSIGNTGRARYRGVVAGPGCGGGYHGRSSARHVCLLCYPTYLPSYPP